MIESKGRADRNSGYSRLLGNDFLGQLFSQVHATVIRTGNELEKILLANTPFAASYEEVFGSTIVFAERPPKQVLYNVGIPEVPGSKLDFVVIDHVQQKVYVVEVKDGDTFDTKKSSGELSSLRLFSEKVGEKLAYQASFYFCSFNLADKRLIVAGAKNRFSLDQVMTGRDFCDLIGVDYDLVVESRKEEQVDNLSYFLDQLLKIEEVQDYITRCLAGEPGDTAKQVLKRETST